MEGQPPRHQGVDITRRETEAGAAILPGDAGAGQHEARAEFPIEALDKADRETVAVGRAEPDGIPRLGRTRPRRGRSEEHTSELQSLMRISYAVFCLKKKKQTQR